MKRKTRKKESLPAPAVETAIAVCPLKGAFKAAQPFKAVMRNFVEFEPFRVFAIQKRNRNRATAPLWNGSFKLQTGCSHSQIA